jgi:flagellar motor switch protein FliN/FliY
MTYAWIKHVEHAIEELEEVPLWGSPPPFPWEQLSELLKELTETSHVAASAGATEWRSHHDLSLGMGKKPLHLTFEAPSLAGHVHWIMPAEDAVHLLSSESLDINQVKQFADPRWQEGFVSYVALEVLRLLTEQGAFGDLNFSLASSVPLPEEGGFSTSVQIEIGGKAISGRLVAPRPFHAAFKAHFASSGRTAIRRSEHIPLTLSLQAGSTLLPVSTWKKVKAGDCLLLDHCYLDPMTLKGTVTLALGKTPLFHVKLKAEQTKILDYAFYFEDEMSDEIPIDDESKDEEAQVEPMVEEVIPVDEIPMTLTVEVGKVKMSLAKLLELAPGNLLELAVRPEMGVSLTAHGKVVARGELVRIGEGLGVKIDTVHN